MGLEIYEWLWLTAGAMLAYYIGMNLTNGVRLYPRLRNNNGEVIKHPLHTIEAFFWPVTWAAWVLVRLLVFWGSCGRILGSQCYRFGRVLGDVAPPTDPQFQRRLNKDERR